MSFDGDLNMKNYGWHSCFTTLGNLSIFSILIYNRVYLIYFLRCGTPVPAPRGEGTKHPYNTARFSAYLNEWFRIAVKSSTAASKS
jgi:hypothetical protein